MLHINEAVWSQINILFQERICEELTAHLNGYQRNLGICHDFFIGRIDFGPQVPNFKLVNFSSPSNQADSLGIEFEISYDGNFGIELEATVGFEPEQTDNNLDLLTGLISAVTRSVQLPLKVDVFLTTLLARIQVILYKESLREVKVKVEGLKMKVIPQLVSSKYDWIGSRIEQQLEKHVRDSLERDLPLKLGKLFSNPNKKRIHGSVLRAPSIAKSVRSHLQSHSIKTGFF